MVLRRVLLEQPVLKMRQRKDMVGWSSVVERLLPCTEPWVSILVLPEIERMSEWGNRKQSLGTERAQASKWKMTL